MNDDRADRVKRAVLHEYIVASGIPAKDRVLFLSGEYRTDVLPVPLPSGPERILVLAGNPGCGKTTAAARWIFEWCQGAAEAACSEHGFDTGARVLPALFVTAPQLARWSRYDDEEMARLLRAPRLVLDDLGMEYRDTKGHLDSVIDEVVNQRYADLLPTVITTNATPAQFADRVGPRIIDRIREAGRFVDSNAKSLRGAR